MKNCGRMLQLAILADRRRDPAMATCELRQSIQRARWTGFDGLVVEVEGSPATVMPWGLYDPEKTRQSQHPRHETWATTGDLGYVDSDGFLYLTDRAAFTIIVGGVNVYPQESENVLINHPAVYDVAVIGVPEPDGRPFDPGAQVPFNNPDWRGGFKVPSLREVARTAPYMHNGLIPRLSGVLAFYNVGGARPRAPARLPADAPPFPQPDPLLRPRGLSRGDLQDIEAFLRTL